MLHSCNYYFIKLGQTGVHFRLVHPLVCLLGASMKEQLIIKIQNINNPYIIDFLSRLVDSLQLKMGDVINHDLDDKYSA